MREKRTLKIMQSIRGWFHRLRSSEGGFTLIEVMIAMTITLVIAFGLAELIVSTTRSEKEIKISQDIYNFNALMEYENKVQPPPTPGP